MANEANEQRTAPTRPTRYYILRRNRRTGVINPDGEREARGAEKAISDYLDDDKTAEIAEHESVVAVPVSNWTERGARVKKIRSVELVDLAPLTLLSGDPVEIVAEDDAA